MPYFSYNGNLITIYKGKRSNGKSNTNKCKGRGEKIIFKEQLKCKEETRRSVEKGKLFSEARMT